MSTRAAAGRSPMPRGLALCRVGALVWILGLLGGMLLAVASHRGALDPTTPRAPLLGALALTFSASSVLLVIGLQGMVGSLRERAPAAALMLRGAQGGLALALVGSVLTVAYLWLASDLRAAFASAPVAALTLLVGILGTAALVLLAHGLVRLLAAGAQPLAWGATVLVVLGWLSGQVLASGLGAGLLTRSLLIAGLVVILLLLGRVAAHARQRPQEPS